MTLRFRCYALRSNELDLETARRRGIDGFVESSPDTFLIEDIAEPADLRSAVAQHLRDKIQASTASGAQSITVVLGHRSSWSDADLKAIDFGLIDGASGMPAHAIDRAYPPPSIA